MSNQKSIGRIPSPPRRTKWRTALARVFGSLLVLTIVGGLLVAAAASWAYVTYTAPGPLKEAKILDIGKGIGRAGIAATLAENGVISDARVMSLASAIQAMRGSSLKPGEYSFPASVSMAEVYNIIASGRVVMYKLTIPEGWTSEMAVDRLREHEALAGELAAVPPEGSVVANTFLFPRGRERASLLREMMLAQAKLVDEVWLKRPADSVIKTPQELVTLASIVEKETGKADERPRVAAVFLNRLKAGMRLQSDPTIIYGIAGGKGKLDRPLSRADIDQKTPYNTYQIDGLPPGPIANPGRLSLEAVIFPAPSPDLYFVADGTGGHVFAATLDEHNANVAKWRVIEDQGGAVPSAPAPGDAGAASTVIVTQPALPDVVAEPAPVVAAAPAPAATAVPEKPKTVAAEKPVEPDVAEAAPAQKPAELVLKPGTIMEINGKLIPIPALKTKKPQ